ncbi:hypothetical protein NG99_26875 [Erwinia typographi]|uniref:Uncharacterized protein n=1 Tax=Erwinia typographi TaxID=371042 RepID=A0A0A3YHM5_9GAMM|nr:hypothetical protein NG99_26875 [Erwinia typographi]
MRIALKGFGKISEAWQKVKSWFGMGKDEVAKADSEAQPVTPAPPAQDMTYGGQTQLQAEASNPITSMTSNAISNSSRKVSQRVQTCGLTISRSRHRPPMRKVKRRRSPETLRMPHGILMMI